jgi:hypothetical protein
MFYNLDFDDLSKRSYEPDSTIEAKNDLWGNVFALPEWFFIARGTFPDVQPYIASNPTIADGQYMIRCFTDTEKLYRFAQENNLLTENAESLILSMPSDSIVEYLEQWISRDVYGIWFNSDNESHGFFSPLAQLRVIKSHLKEIGWSLV